MATNQEVKVNNPNELITAIRDFAVANGWTVLENLKADLPIAVGGTSDGLFLAMKAPGENTCFALLRSANGKAIFEETIGTGYGLGLTIAGDFVTPNASGLWYDQQGVPKNLASQKVIGVGIPCLNGVEMTAYLNFISAPAPMIVVSLEIFKGTFQHLAFGVAQKTGAWNGGSIMSGSRNSYRMFSQVASPTAQTIDAESELLFSFSSNPSTFLRSDIDAAPLRKVPVSWASSCPSGKSGFTGKILGLPVVNKADIANAPKIPHYQYMQSQTATDTGRNVNTLNCITVNLPIALYVQRDPDGLMNFSQCGYVPGVYCISCRNVGNAQKYEISYPQSGNLHQAFPQTRRAGVFGYDGISIKQ